MNWPKPFTHTTPFTDWLNRLLAGVKSNELKSGVGYRVKTTSNGTTLEILGGAMGGQTVYVKACLEDGTECYVPIKVFGTIYRDRADAPGTTPTIDAGKVPDGSPELI